MSSPRVAEAQGLTDLGLHVAEVGNQRGWLKGHMCLKGLWRSPRFPPGCFSRCALPRREYMGGARRPPPDACDGEGFDLPPTLHATWLLGGFNEHAFHEPRSRAYVFQGHSDAFLWKWFLLPVSSVGCLTFFLIWRSCLRVRHAALGT